MLIKKDYNSRLNIDNICIFVKSINNDESTISTNNSSSSLININFGKEIFIKFTLGEEEFFKSFNENITLKEMFQILKGTIIIKSFHNSEVIFLYHSFVLNKKEYSCWRLKKYLKEKLM